MGDTYDVALSFAGEQRAYVRELAGALAAHNLSVFFDEFYEAEIWGKDLGDYLDDIYRKRSRFVVICISKEYRDKKWTNHERKSALAAAIESDTEKVLPLRFDDSELPGLRSTTAHVSAQEKRPTEIAELLARKLFVGKLILANVFHRNRSRHTGFDCEHVEREPAGRNIEASKLHHCQTKRRRAIYNMGTGTAPAAAEATSHASDLQFTRQRLVPAADSPRAGNGTRRGEA